MSPSPLGSSGRDQAKLPFHAGASSRLSPALHWNRIPCLPPSAISFIACLPIGSSFPLSFLTLTLPSVLVRVGLISFQGLETLPRPARADIRAGWAMQCLSSCSIWRGKQSACPSSTWWKILTAGCGRSQPGELGRRAGQTGTFS